MIVVMDFVCYMVALYRAMETAQKSEIQVQNVVPLCFLPLVYLLNEQVLSTLEKLTVAEILKHEARVVINMSLCQKWRVREVHAEVAHPDVRDHVDKAKVVMLFETTGVD